MKKKNIFNAAFLKLWLVLFALVPAIAAIGQVLTNSPSFSTLKNSYYWYHNGDGGLYNRAAQAAQDGDVCFYRYFANSEEGPFVGSSKYKAYVNGKKSGFEGIYGTYEFKKGDAVGFKLNKDYPWRIKIYYLESITDDNSPVESDKDYEYSDPILYWSTSSNNVNNCSSDNIPGTKASVEILNSDIKSTGTRLLTYDIPKSEKNTVFWIKNTSDKVLYFAGFDVVPLKSEVSAPTVTFKGESWYVDANPNNDKKNQLESTQVINIAGSSDNVIVGGFDMAINDYKIGSHKTVMLNNGSKIGVKLPKGAKISFTYVADPGVGLKIIDDSNNNNVYESVSQYGSVNVEYSNETGDDQTLWITGRDINFVYFSGFTVTQETPTTQTIADAKVISSDYVWHPVKDKFFEAGTLTDEYTLNAGAALSSNGRTVNMYTNEHQTYNVNGENIIGFKVAAGKSGVINFFGSGWAMKIYPTLEDAKNKTNAYGLNGYSYNGVQISPYFFSAGNEREFWLSTGNNVASEWDGSDSFGGFEVLFDSSSNVLDLATAGGNKFDCGSINQTITNAIGSTDSHRYVRSTYNGVNGPSMLYYPVSGSTVMIGCRNEREGEEPGIRNAMVFKVSDNTFNTVEVNTYLANDATVKVCKGSESEPDRNAIVAEITDAGAKSTIIDISGDPAGQVYWLISDKMAGAHVRGIFAKKDYSSLQTINTHYIYNVGNVPTAGIISGTDGHVKLVGKVTAGSPMTVLGQQNNSIVLDEGDYLGIKVGTNTKDDKNIKTGYIKVYLNGGLSDSHKMEELPLDQPLGAGNNSSYDPETHTMTIGENGGSRGWWYGNSPLKLEAYNKINVEVESVVGNTDRLQLVVQDADGNAVGINYDAVNKRFNGSLPGDSKLDMSKISQIYIQTWKNSGETETVEPVTLKIKSARLMNKPVVISTGTDENVTPTIANEVFGGKIYDVQDAHVYCYPFNLENTADPLLYWISGDEINIAAIEVVYDESENAKVVEWFVNKDTKMIVGSDDPNWKWSGFSGNEAIGYTGEFDECVTFYVSAGRQAHVSFIMPEAVAEVEDWYNAVKNAGVTGKTKVKESDVEAAGKSYGKHTIVVNRKKTTSGIGMQEDGWTMTYNRNTQYADLSSITSDKNDKKVRNNLYDWYSVDYTLPSALTDNTNIDHYEEIVVTATQKPADKDEKWNNEDIETVQEKKGQWKILMRFVFYKAPDCTNSNNTVSVTSGTDGAGPIYYTVDSSDPEDLASMNPEDRDHSATNQGDSFSVEGMNCIVKAAQYLTTDYEFYEDCILGEAGGVSRNLKLVSEDLNVVNENDKVVYVKDEDPTDVTENELFNYQPGGYMLTLPTGKETMKVKGRKYYIGSDDKLQFDTTDDQYEQKYNPNPWMYLSLGGKDWPYVSGTTAGSPEFSLCGTNWVASKDGGLKTYLDSYQFMMTFTDAAITDSENEHITESAWGKGNENQNPYTEVNGGVGGPTTEAGGMFLQPIGGTMLRFEPEYDGVVTVWLRQNGCLDNNTQENGKFTRRPVFIMDENGRIMTRTTVKPTASHYLGINGTWAINSSVCEERSQVEHTWLYAVAKQVFENHPLYADRFKNFPNRWEKTVENGNEFVYMNSANDHRGAMIMYGWWYNGFNLDATRSTITSASHVSRYEYMEPELLYRSDKIFDMEMNELGLSNTFAKYGYELPNFQYVRYRIPVKAGKTYYIAGRGTKNGFSAISFDPVKANTNGNPTEIATLRYKDNPGVKENSDPLSERYLKPESDWGKAGSSTGNASETVMINSYDNLKTVHIYENGNNNYEDNIQPEIKYDMDNLGNLVGQTVDVQLHRTFTAGYWHPIILPFSVSETRLEQYFGEGTKVLYLDPYKHTFHNKTDNETNRSYASVLSPALENSKLYFTYHRYQMLYANTPAFICPTFTWSDEKKAPATNNVHPTPSNGVVKDITFKRVTLDGSNSRNDKGNGLFGYDISNDYEVVGTYDEIPQDGDVYYVTNTKGTAQLIHSKGDSGQSVVMRGTRVWIRPKQTAVNPAPIRTVGAKDFTELDFDFGNDEAGINDIVNDDITVERYVGDSGVYDLLGRKIAEDSLEGVPAGVYIFNGRKVYVN